MKTLRSLFIFTLCLLGWLAPSPCAFADPKYPFPVWKILPNGAQGLVGACPTKEAADRLIAEDKLKNPKEGARYEIRQPKPGAGVAK
jgi:hypothetical protein